MLVGILCLQWLREFQRDAPLPHIEAVALRQMRYEGLRKWYVPEILSILPLLLQLSLVLFFIGLLDLLWSLNTLVAACVSAAVGMVMLFLIATTALPALQPALTRDRHLRVPQCPYKSPQSWHFYRAGRWFCHYLLRLFYHYLFRGSCWLIFRRSGNIPRSGDIPRSFLHPFEHLRANNWLEYDICWRGLRDAEDISWERLRYSDDVVYGLRWINETFAHGVEAILPVYQYLADLDIPAATAMISQLYLTESRLRHATSRGFDDDTFNTMMDGGSPLNEMQQRDIIVAYYLKLYQYRDPVLKTMYVETVIRILNTEVGPKPFYNWFSHILWDLRWERLPAQLNTNEITIQILLCVNKLLITRDILVTDDVITAWILLRRLLTLPPFPPPNLPHSTHPTDSEPPNPGLGLNLDHITLAGGFFEALKGWLSQGEETDRWERVKECMEGMIRLFSSSIDIAALHAKCPVQMAKAAGLVRALDERMSRLGGAAAVLERKRSIWEHTYKVGEWDLLVSRFKGIEGGGGHSVEITAL